jgi:hypothetical protein
MKSMVSVVYSIKNYAVGLYRRVRQQDVVDTLNSQRDSLISERDALKWLVENYENETERLMALERQMNESMARHTAQTRKYHDEARDLAQRLGNATGVNITMKKILEEEILRNSELTKILADMQLQQGSPVSNASYDSSKVPRLYVETFLGLLPKHSTVPIDKRDGNNHDHHSYMDQSFREFRRHVCELPWIVKVFCTYNANSKKQHARYSILGNGIIDMEVPFNGAVFVFKVSTTAQDNTQRTLIAEVIKRYYERRFCPKQKG